MWTWKRAFLDYTDVMRIVADLVRKVIFDLLQQCSSDLRLTLADEIAELHAVVSQDQDEISHKMEEMFGISDEY